MVELNTEETAFKFIAGWQCLDFANTVNWDSEHIHDRLHSYADLVSWNQVVGALTGQEARQLLQVAVQRPADAAMVFRQAISLRAAIHELFSALAAGHPASPADLASLNTALPLVLAQSQLVSADGRFTWAWVGETPALERVFWSVLWSTAELLTSEQLERVGKCAAAGCGWLFLDTSRNHSRRWCDMKDCGNRAKARRHYRRRRAQ